MIFAKNFQWLPRLVLGHRVFFMLLTVGLCSGTALLSSSQSAYGQEKYQQKYPLSFLENQELPCYKPVPVPGLGLALVGLGIGLARKRKATTSQKTQNI